IGSLQKHWDVAQSAKVFTMLTIGDGLTAQIPAFVVSIAAALIVTRSGSKQQLGTELTTQLTSQPVGLFITAAFLGLLLLTPLPKTPLFAIAAGLVAIGWSMTRTTRKKKDA